MRHGKREMPFWFARLGQLKSCPSHSVHEADQPRQGNQVVSLRVWEYSQSDYLRACRRDVQSGPQCCTGLALGYRAMVAVWMMPLAMLALTISESFVQGDVSHLEQLGGGSSVRDPCSIKNFQRAPELTTTSARQGGQVPRLYEVRLEREWCSRNHLLIFIMRCFAQWSHAEVKCRTTNVKQLLSWTMPLAGIHTHFIWIVG